MPAEEQVERHVWGPLCRCNCVPAWLSSPLRFQPLSKRIHCSMPAHASSTHPHTHPFVQALSKRIHYGMFVAEAKFRKQPAEYTELIRRQDAAAILELLTDRAVELKVCGDVCE